MKKISCFLILIFLSLSNYGCNTITGTAKGIAEDIASIVPGF